MEPYDDTRALHPGVMRAWRYGSLITTAIVAGLALMVDFLVFRREGWYPLPVGVFTVLIAALVAGLGQGLVRRQYIAWRYALRPHDLTVMYGVVWRTRRCIPRVRVQHVDIQSGPIDRALGLVQLHVFSAGSVGAVTTIPGLSPEDAERLRDELLGITRGP